MVYDKDISGGIASPCSVSFMGLDITGGII